MGITPAGNRRQMKCQSYADNDFASSKIGDMLEKFAATLDLDQGVDKDLFKSDQRPPMPEATSPSPAAEGGLAPQKQQPNVGDAMNQSNSLPQKQQPASGGLEDKVTQIVQAVLQGLKIDSSQWIVNNSSSSDGETLTSIRIDMKRKQGLDVQKQ